ncbi:MAG: bifunctional nuclease family protein [Deferrisomatales bacterium]|nr:bifunctional nuclease family protein [Deferrisomatales bacterium]
MYVQMKILGIAIDPHTKGPVVLLRDVAERYTLPIWVGLLEAASISHALEGTRPPRPLTHDLTRALLGELGGEIPRVEVDALVDNVFHAKLHLQLPEGERRLVDCRPSDALALALRCGAEIFAAEDVLQSAAKVVVREAGAQPDDDSWKEFLEDLDPGAFGKYKM